MNRLRDMADYVYVDSPLIIGYVSLCVLCHLLSLIVPSVSYNMLSIPSWSIMQLSYSTPLRLVSYCFGHNGFDHIKVS